MSSLLLPILLIIAGLAVGVFFKSLSKYINIPYTVILFGVGIVFGVLSRYGIFDSTKFLNEGIKEVADLDPDFILYVFLPILIFDAAYEMNLHIFKKTLLNATILAGPGLVICMFLTAALIVAFFVIQPNGTSEWQDWTYALMFGALISATDPVAVVALLQELKTSKRFSTLVDGESLLNDGTGIVCFMLFYSAFVGEKVSMNPFLYFAYVCVGSIVIGYIIAEIVLWFITHVSSEDIIQNSVIIIAAYITFIIAQKAFDISGVIALVAYGHLIAQKGRPHLKPQVNAFMEKFWELLAYIANTLIFIIVGIIIANKVEITVFRLVLLLVMYIGVILIRYIMIYVLYPILRISGYGINFRETIILGWGGLRGALGMTLALMVYSTETIPLEIRSDILFLTAGIITLTLLINATTSKWLLSKLHLVKAESTARNLMHNRVIDNIRQNDQEYIENLKKLQHMQETDWEEVSSHILPPAEPLEENDSVERDTLMEIRIKILDTQRETVNSIYESGIISQLSYSRMLETIDDLYDSEGAVPLDKHSSILSMRSQYWLLAVRNIQKAIHFFPNSDFAVRFYAKKVARIYDVCRGIILTHEASNRLVDNIDESNIISSDYETEILGQVRKEIASTIDRANFLLDKLKENFPRSYNKAVTDKAVRMLLANERDKILDMHHRGVITEEDTVNLLQRLRKRT